MRSTAEMQQAIERLFTEWRALPGPESTFEIVAVCDRERDRYVLLEAGWDGKERVHSLLADLEIRDGKVWVQADNTDRPFADALVRLGIPHRQIVLGFRSPERRAVSDFAAA